VTPVNTRRLFIALLRDLGIDTVCDVGSMNGEDALAFRRRLPRARILALEPNPANLRAMRVDPRIAAADIEVVAAAASDLNARAPFFLVEAEYHSSNEERGKSSLHRRDPGTYPTTAVEVDTVRLDTLLAPLLERGARLALWIDVEGHACEVLEGLRALAPRVTLLHIEVESQPCIAPGQRLYPEALALLTSWNFREIATDLPHSTPQFNALFVHDDLAAHEWRRVEARLFQGRLQRRLVHASQALCPACLRRMAAWRDRLAAQRQRRFSRHPASGVATKSEPFTDR
jgi:FkbM family methyltransferase